MKPAPPQPRTWREVAATLLLAAVLAQVMMFFFGLTVPLNRIFLLWNKTRDERLKIIWQPGSALTQIAAEFPTNAHLYYAYPESFLHKQVQYYFYPRRMSVTMTNAKYQETMYTNWDERPTVEWLVTNQFTYVVSFKGGVQAWQVRPGMAPVPGFIEK